MEYHINLPVDSADLTKLRAGDTVYLSGMIYTARDQAHKRIIESISSGNQLPFDLNGSAIYYVGPTPEKEGYPIGSAGPTTAGRMDKYSPDLIALGNKIMIGKGKRNEAVKNAIIKHKAVYLGALGGAGALMANSITAAELVAWPDLGCEAVRKLTVKDMPLTVIIDTLGNDLYESGPVAYLRSCK